MFSKRVFLLLVWCVGFVVFPVQGQQQAYVDHFLGLPGIGSQDGQGAQAHFYHPYGMWTDGATLYVVDAGNLTVRKISLDTDIVTTVAGGVQQPSPAIDGIGLAARFKSPEQIWGFGSSLYVTDSPALRQIDPTSASVTSITLPTAYPGAGVPGTVVANSTRLYFLQGVYGCTGMFCAGSNEPFGIFPAYIMEFDPSSGATRQVHFADGQQPYAIWADDHFVYATFSSAGGTLSLQKLDLSTFQLLPPYTIGTPSSSNNSYTPTFIWGNSVGQLFVADNRTLYKADPGANTVSVVATPGYSISGLTGYGNLLFASTASSVIRIDANSGAITTVAGVAPGNGFNPQSVWGDGQYLYATTGNTIQKISLLTRETSTLAAGIQEPAGIWGHAGTLYVHDQYAGNLDQVDATTGALTVAVPGLGFSSQITGDDQYVYVTRFNPDNSMYVEQISLAAGTRQTANFSDGLHTVTALWSDGAHLFVADGCAIRKFTLPNNQSTLLSGQPVSGQPGNCYASIAQDGLPPNVVFSTIKALWGVGNTLYVVDDFNNVNHGPTIRSVDATTGETHTIAGNAAFIGTEDGFASQARFAFPAGLWGDSQSLYVAENGLEGIQQVSNGAIRRVTLPTATVTGMPFAVEPNGANYFQLSSTATAVSSGSAVLTADASGTTPAGIMIFSYRNNGVLVSETAVPAEPPVYSGRIFAEVSPNARTGIALANPNGNPATVSFYFTDATGNDSGAGSLILGANAQVSAFLDEAPFSGSAQARTFTFTSSSPIGAIALRGFTNERSDFLMTTLPVASLPLPSTAPLPPSSNAPLLIPQFADGGGWQTELLLINPTDGTISGTARFDTAYSYSYSIPPRSSATFQTPATSSTILTGAISITPDPNSYSPVASTVFSFVENGITVTQNGVATTDVAAAFRVFAEMNSGSTSLRTGIAVANNSSLPANLQFQLLDSSGVIVSSQGSVTLDPNGHLSKFINELPGFNSVPVPFHGVLRVISDQPIAVIGLRGQLNERGEFLIASTPAISESTPPSNELIFPDVVTGGGYSTEILLVTPGNAASGSITLRNQNGGSN